MVLTIGAQVTLGICAALRNAFWERHTQFELNSEERYKNDGRTGNHVMGGMMEKLGIFLFFEANQRNND